MASAEAQRYGEGVSWQPQRPRLHPGRLLLAWAVGAASVAAAAWLLPGVALERSGAALSAAAALAVLNAVLPPVLAALRLPFMVAIGFVLVLVADALLLQLASELLPDAIRVDSFGDALLAALVMAAVSLVLQIVLGTDDDDEYTLHVTRRIARRQRPDHEPLDRRGGLPAHGVGDRSLVADRRQPGRHPARLQ